MPSFVARMTFGKFSANSFYSYCKSTLLLPFLMFETALKTKTMIQVIVFFFFFFFFFKKEKKNKMITTLPRYLNLGMKTREDTNKLCLLPYKKHCILYTFIHVISFDI